MRETDWLAERFEEHRSRLRAVAYRILGSASEADDALQEAWLRLSRADTGGVDDLGGWLTTVLSRVCLNMLQARRSRPQPQADTELPEPIASQDESDPEYEALLADSVGLALLVVLDTLTPAERVAFVLHDIFAIPFDQIAPIVERSTAATRQLASRARARVQEPAAARQADRLRQAALVDAFLAAARHGDFDALLAVLDPDVVLRADKRAVELGAAEETRGGRTRRRLLTLRTRLQPRAARPRAGRGLDAWRPPAGRVALHHQRRPDHRDRPDRQSGAPPSAQPRHPRRSLNKACKSGEAMARVTIRLVSP